MTYRERREARAERLQEWAAKRNEKALAEHAKAEQMASGIPFGQPILVGHHSERRDRNYREKIGRTFERSFENLDKAKSMTSRADGIRDQLDNSIYSDDEDAVERLKERIAGLEAERDRIKAFNASCRKGKPDESLLDESQRAGLDSVRRHSSYSLGKGGAMPSYALSNLSGNIKRNRDRLAVIRAEQARRERADEAGGVVVEPIVSALAAQLGHSYVRVTFAEKPSRDTINELKAAGFRWAKGSWVGTADQLPEGIDTESETA